MKINPLGTSLFESFNQIDKFRMIEGLDTTITGNVAPISSSTISGNAPISSTIAPTTGVSSNLFTSIRDQNEILNREIKRISDTYSTDDQRVYYQSSSMENYSVANSSLFFFYYILVLALIVFLVFYIQNISRVPKVLLVIVLMVYPLYILPIEQTVYSAIVYLFSVFNGDVYRNE